MVLLKLWEPLTLLSSSFWLLGQGGSGRSQSSLVDTNLEVKITCVDEASDAVAQASKRISDSLNEVSDSQNRVAQATEETVAPLTESEQAQLSNAGSSLQLSTAETRFERCPREP